MNKDINNKKYFRKGLNKMAKENGIKYYLKYNRFEHAEKLGMDLPPLKPKPKTSRICSRTVMVGDQEFPSMTSAAKVLRKNPNQIYVMVAKDDAKFL